MNENKEIRLQNVSSWSEAEVRVGDETLQVLFPELEPSNVPVEEDREPDAR